MNHITFMGFVFLITLFIADAAFFFNLGKRMGVKIDAKVRKVKGNLVTDYKSVVKAWKDIKKRL